MHSYASLPSSLLLLILCSPVIAESLDENIALPKCAQTCSLTTLQSISGSNGGCPQGLTTELCACKFIANYDACVKAACPSPGGNSVPPIPAAFDINSTPLFLSIANFSISLQGIGSLSCLPAPSSTPASASSLPTPVSPATTTTPPPGLVIGGAEVSRSVTVTGNGPLSTLGTAVIGLGSVTAYTVSVGSAVPTAGSGGEADIGNAVGKGEDGKGAVEVVKSTSAGGRVRQGGNVRLLLWMGVGMGVAFGL